MRYVSSSPPESSSGNPVLAFQNLSPDEMLDAVESCGIRCDGRFLALNSYENRVYQVGLDDESQVVAKFYRPDRWSDQAIIEEHLFTRELEELEIPVIAPLSIGDRTLHHTGPYRFALYPCRGGRAPELDNSSHLEILGRFVARLHNAGAAGSYTSRPAITIDAYITAPADFVVEEGYVPDYLVDNWRGVIEAVSEKAAAAYYRAGSISSIRLHGDLHHGNVLWTARGPHLVDFDDARSGPALQDLWMFLSGDRAYMQQRLGDLIGGYEQFRDFDRAELQILETLRSMRMVHHAGWLASRWEDPAFPTAFPWFNTDRYWEQLIADLYEQLELMDGSALTV